jgi:3-phosphoshikimate 1-carboxyvinyltransferase
MQRLELKVDASLSSQFLTGLALAAAALPGTSHLSWDAAASPSYLLLTDHWLHQFGCEAILEPGRWTIPGGCLRPQHLRLPGDWSGAAAFLAAAATCGRQLQLGPLDPGDPQGDRAMVDILTAAGCAFSWAGAELKLQGQLQQGLDADLSHCPDLGPVLAALAALAPGPSELRGLETLPLKECDRLEASADLVRWLGGQAEVIGQHTLRIHPGAPPARTRRPFDPRQDHRMAFAAAVGALRFGGELQDPQCVAKTFPTFWETWREMLEC